MKVFKLDSAAPWGVSCSLARNPETVVHKTACFCSLCASPCVRRHMVISLGNFLYCLVFMRGAAGKWHLFTIYRNDFWHVTVHIVEMQLFSDSPLGTAACVNGIMEEVEKRMEKEKKQQEEKEYGLFSNYWFLYKGFFKSSKWNIVFILMILVGGIFSHYIRLYIPKVAVDLVTEQVSVQRLLGGLLGIELVYFLFDEIYSVGGELLNNPGLKYRHVLEEKMLSKICRTAYSNLEDPDYKNKLGRAQHLYLHWDRDARECIWSSLNFGRLLITIPVTSGLMAGLHPILVAVLAVGAWLQYLAENIRLSGRKNILISGSHWRGRLPILQRGWEIIPMRRNCACMGRINGFCPSMQGCFRSAGSG